MTIFKKIMVSVFLLSAFTISAAQAQNSDTPKKSEEVKESSTIGDLAEYAEIFVAKFEKLKEKFALTEDQSTQIKDIVADNAIDLVASYMKLKTASKSEKAALSAAFMENILGVKEKVFGVLTPSQRTDAEKLFKETVGKKINEKEKDAEKENSKKN